MATRRGRPSRPETSRASAFERVKNDALARVDSGVAALHARADRWVNPMTGIGTWDDKSRAGHFEFPWRLMDAEITALASGNDLAAKVIEKRPREMFRRGYELEPVRTKAGKSPEDQKSLLQEVTAFAREELLLDTRLRQGMTFGRQYGGTVALLGLEDGQEATQPLNEDNLRSFRFINVVDRRFSYVLSYYSNFMTPKFGHPEMYLVSNGIATYSYRDINTGTFGIRRKSPAALNSSDYYVQRIHESRLIRFDGVETDAITRMTLAGWSWSVLQRPYEVLRQTDHSFDSIVALLADASQGVLKLKGLIQAISAGNEGKIQTRMEVVDRLRSVLRTVAIDADSEDFTRVQTPMTGLPDALDRIMQRFAAAADMPLTEVFGMSPAGLNATGESDRIKWYDTIANEQTNDLAPIIRRVFKLIAMARESPFKGRDIEFKIHFAPLYSPTDEELAKTRLANAQRDELYLEYGVITPEKVALTLTEVYPSIDVEELEDEIQNKTQFDPYAKEKDLKTPHAANPSPAPGVSAKPDIAEPPTTAVPQLGGPAPVGSPGDKGKSAPSQGNRGDRGRWDAVPAPDGEEIAAAVYAQLADDYPNKAIAWVKQRRYVVRWEGPVRIPLDRIDWTGREKWAATHEPDKIEQHATSIATGREKPIVTALRPGAKRVKILDGHHRGLAAEELDTPVVGYIAHLARAKGPWDEMHAAQREGSFERSAQMYRSRQTNKGDGAFELPKAHKPFLVLPGWDKPAEKAAPPGFSCANCRYLKDPGDGTFACGNSNYEQWAETDRLVDPDSARPVLNPQQACSDWFEPREPRGDFDDDEPRDEHGQWTSGGGSGGAKASKGASSPPQGSPYRVALTKVVQAIRKAPAAIGRVALEEVKEKIEDFKGAALGVKNFLTGHPVTPEQKRAIRHTAVFVATAILSAHVSPLLHVASLARGETTEKLLEEVSDQAVHHVLEHLARKGLKLDASIDPEEWLATQIATAVADAIEAHAATRQDFDPDHARDETGKWSAEGGSSSGKTAGSGRGSGSAVGAGPTPPTASGSAAGVIHESHAGDFRAAFEHAFSGSPFTNHVSHYSEEELKGMRTFLSADGKAGIAVHDHGDGRIEGTALFNQGAPKGAGAALLRHVVEHAGVNYLECYGDGLRKLYESAGFKVQSSSPFNPEYAAKDWDYEKFGTPNYYTLRLSSSGGKS